MLHSFVEYINLNFSREISNKGKTIRRITKDSTRCSQVSEWINFNVHLIRLTMTYQNC